MKVLKFGGTSVGSAQRMKEVAKLITDGEQKIVVLSAMSGTTNTLVEISDYLYKKNPEGANEIINRLEAKYKQHANELYSTDEYKQKTQEFIKAQFDYIRSYTKDIFTLFEEKVILAQGELISTNMVTNYLQEQGVNAILLPALEFMRTDKNSEPDPVYIKEKLAAQLEIHPDAEIYITQGFICRNAYGEIDNLQRGGSDYTASLIGAAVNASEIQIWTAAIWLMRHLSLSILIRPPCPPISPNSIGRNRLRSTVRKKKVLRTIRRQTEYSQLQMHKERM